MKITKRILSAMLIFALALCLAADIRANASSGNFEMAGYEYPADCYVPTRFTGTPSWYIQPDGYTKYAYRNAALNGTYVDDYVTYKADGARTCIALMTDAAFREDTQAALASGQPWNFNNCYSIDDNAFIGNNFVKNIVVNRACIAKYLGRDCFKNSAVETILFTKDWNSEATENSVCGDLYKKCSSLGFGYDWTYAEKNEVLFGRAALIIEEGAFSGCRNLVTVYFEREPARLYIGEGAFTGCPNLTITAPYGGVIEAYCKAHGIGFKALDIPADTEIIPSYWDEFKMQLPYDADGSGYKPTHTAATSPATEAKPASSIVEPFADVKATDYFAEPVKWAVEKAITTGTGKTAFGPEQTCTVGQILTFLWRAKGSPEPANPSTSSEYYANAARWAMEQGLIDSYGFNPTAACTRGMVVEYLWKLAGKPAAETSKGFSDVPAGLAAAVDWAAGQGITTGTSKTAFSPEQTCTRGQIVTFLYRAYAE